MIIVAVVITYYTMGVLTGFLAQEAESTTAPPLSFAQDMAQRIAANPISAYEHAASLASANQSIDNWSTQAMGFGDNANSPRSEVTVSANPIGGLLGKAGKAVLASVADGLSLVMDTASYAGQAVYPHEVIPESSLGKLVTNGTISFTDKLKTVGFGALGMVGNVLKGDPEAVGGLLGSIISGKLVKVPEIVKTEVSGGIAGADGGRIAANNATAASEAAPTTIARYNAAADSQAANVGANSAENFAADEVRFSQNSVSFGKVDRGNGQAFTYDDLVTSMRTNGWKGDPVDVVRMPDGGLTSIDNTRISAAREAGIDVQANVHTFDAPLTADEIGRFTKGSQVPATWGDAVTIRINSQSGGFGVKNPYGADTLPRVTGRPK